MKHLGDITLIKGNEAPVVDCVIGGSPCQDLSLAGKRAGLAGSRSGLYMEQIRIIKEMREADVLRGKSDIDIRPRYMVWENVPGAFSTNAGRDFAVVLEEAIRVAEPEAPNIPVPEKGWPTSGCFWDELGKWSVAWRVLDAQFWGTSDKPLPQRRRRIALVTDFGGLSAPEILFVRKSVSGNTEPGEQKRKEAPRNAEEGTGGANGPIAFHLLQDPIYDYSVSPCIGQGNSKNGQGSVGVTFADVASTLRSSAGAPKHEADFVGRLVAQPTEHIYTIDRETFNCGQNFARNLGIGNDGVVPTLKAVGPGGVYVSHIVRRLTPLECERLQGYPDGWTDIGEWVDSKGKKHKEADSPRYKALGNSIAIPPWKWVLKRLCACYERDATMASLFDGIGGFPFIWEQLNGKGSCLWVSEIEEFPMAVTKVRFGG